VKPHGFAGKYITPSPEQARLYSLSKRKQREYAVFRLFTQPASAATLTLGLCTIRRGSLEGWRDDVSGILAALSWAVPLALLLVFGPALAVARGKKQRSN
jgi:hypothetical protein